MRTHPVDKLLEQHCYKCAADLLQLIHFYVCRSRTAFLNRIGWNTRKNLTSCNKSANKPSTSCVRIACPKLSTSLEQAVNNL